MDLKRKLQVIIDELHDSQNRIAKFEAAIEANKRWMRRLEANKILVELMIKEEDDAEKAGEKTGT